MRRLAAVACLLVLLVAGCAAPAPVVQRYRLGLEAPDTDPRLPDRARTTLRVRSVNLASYLRADGIVYRTDEHTFSVARTHRWVEPLSRQLQDGLTRVLGRRLKSTAVFGASEGPEVPAHTLTVHVDTFYGHHDGTARIEGTWHLRDPGGRLLRREAFASRVTLDEDGYSALVEALSRGWKQTGAAMAKELTASLGSPASEPAPGDRS